MNYKTTVGIEVHCELKTNAKMFSTGRNGYGEVANSNITLLDLGYPGTLPTINHGAILLALRAALILNCHINQQMHFDRKNYFYPDLPKGYQITQARTPIGVDGYVEIEVDGKEKRIGIHDIHIEEDTAKSVHAGDHSLLDFNRAGVPLIEIVTEPDMNSKEEAMAYVTKLRELLLYGNISDCKIEEGSMRCDVNVSVSKNDILGVRTEIKNVGSISNVGLAIEKEAQRQMTVLEQGGFIEEETRRFDEHKMETILMRKKETGNDYRYFPEPDIPYLYITEEEIDRAKKEIPVLPNERRKQYQEAGISQINQDKLIQNRALSDYMLTLSNHCNLVIASNLLLGDVSAYLNKEHKEITDTKLYPEKLTEVVKKIETKEWTSKILKEVLPDLLETDLTIEEIITKHQITKIDDDDTLKQMIEKVMQENETSVVDYKNGHSNAFKYLMGQIMKESKGKANPAKVNDLLKEELEK